LQEDIINSVLQNNDTLALLPTGGGKSICFQVPALAMDGLCMVVSPLIALMKDQVANLNQRGIKSTAIFSGMSSAEIDIAIDNSIYGNTKFLYLSPERLTTEMIRMRLPKMKVCLLAIDEAHCISQWGYDFRPPYLRIAEIREILPQTPVLALTATATTNVIEDICEKLNFKNHNIYRKSFERKNLTYAVLKEEDKLGRLSRICNKVKGTGIVYVRNRKKTREIAKYLLQHNISADFYHAGLDTVTRDKKQDDWMREKSRIIVSTNAFGMGIDKPNVRFVVHMDMPDSPEAYFQEAGRAGRDEKKSYAVLMFNDSDLSDAARFHEMAYPAIDFIKQVYNGIGNYLQIAIGSAQEKSYDFVLTDFCNHYNLETVPTFNALKFLEKEGYIHLSDALANPSRLHFLLNKEELYRFLVANPGYDSFIKVLLRSYAGLFSDFVKISESEIGSRINKTALEVNNMLGKMHQLRVLYYDPQNKKPRITFTLPRFETRDLSISPENYSKRKQYAYERLKAMENYVTSVNRCRSLILLEYFGETDALRCGTCDLCLERNKLDVSKLEFDNILQLVKPYLLNQSVKLEELVTKIKSGIPEDKIIKVVQWLIDNNKIDQDTITGKLSWKG
jgi:ATP-dependent DNA helicase RecQ